MGTFQANAVCCLTKIDDTPTSQTKSRAEVLFLRIKVIESSGT